MIGSTIGNYRITGRLGQGGMGVVYEAEDLRLRRRVALKFLPEETLGDVERLRFVNEAQAAARISHPNVCPIYSIEETDGRIFIAMARLEGETIAQRLERMGAFRIEEAIDIAAQVARGLDQAHRMGIVHRDIKSSNIVLSSDGHASILDFGLAMGGGLSRLTRDGASLGTPAYMSPEQAAGEALDARTDLWSLGVVLYEMLTGRLPFAAGNVAALVNAIMKQQPGSFSEIRPEVAGPVERVVMRALEKQPENRWQCARDMVAELEQLGAGRRAGGSADPSLAETRPLPAAQEGSLTARRAMLAAVLGLAAIGAGIGYWRWKGAGLPDQKQVAVLPLNVVGEDPEVRVMADGLVETLTAQLSELEQFRQKLLVVPASEVRARKITSAAEAKRIYGANLVVTGSAQRWGGRIRFNFALVDSGKLRQLTARSVEFDASNPAGLPGEAIGAVGKLLEVEFTADERRAVTGGSQPGGSAYSEYLKGRGYLSRYDLKGNIEKALESLQKVVQQDPQSALAHAALAEAYWRKASASGDTHWADRAQENAEKAVMLDDQLAVARIRLGEIYAERGRQQDALAELQRALALSPGNPEALGAFADLNVTMGRLKEAEAAYLEATKRRPTDWYAHTNQAVFFLQQARFREAEAALKTAEKLTPDNEIVHRNLAAAYLRQARYPEARAELEKVLKIEPQARSYSALGVAYYYEGRMAEAASACESAIDLNSGTYSFWGNLGTVYRHMPGNEAKAKMAFERAIELGEKLLRMTPADGNLLSNLAEYWAKLGQREKALRYLDRIPAGNRRAYANRFVLVHELVGQRKEAIAFARGLGWNATLVHSIRDDADLKQLWRDPALQAALKETP